MSADIKTDPTPFSSLLRNEQSPLELVQAINSAIAGSYRAERLRGELPIVKTEEVKRRTQICLKWFKILRGDMGWTVEKTLDFLPMALRKEIDGEDFDPPTQNGAWSPESPMLKAGS